MKFFGLLWFVWLLLGGMFSLYFFAEGEWPQGWMPWFILINAFSLIGTLAVAWEMTARDKRGRA